MRFRSLLVVLLAAALVAPASAAAQPTPAGSSASAAAKKVKPCKRKKGESKKRWLKRCKCKAFKKGETRKKFKKRCPGAKVPKRKKAPSGGGTAPTTPTPPAPGAAGALTGQAAVDYVANAMKGMRMSRTACSGNACERSTEELVDFCQDGASLSGRHTTSNSIGGTYEVRYAGTWRVLEAEVNAERTLARAVVEMQITQAEGNDDPPASGNRLLTFVGSNQVYSGETEFTRGTGSC